MGCGGCLTTDARSIPKLSACTMQLIAAIWICCACFASEAARGHLLQIPRAHGVARFRAQHVLATCM